MQVKIHTDDNALLAYIDLLGTKSFYQDSALSIEEKAKMLYETLLERFLVAFKNCFDEAEISENFYINIYADSIMICERTRTENMVEKLISFLLKYQLELMSECNPPILSRAIVGRSSYFSLHIDPASNNPFMGFKNIDISLCGGRGMVYLDSRLNDLPVGIYLCDSLNNESNIDNKRIIKVEVECRKLSFIKQVHKELESPINYFFPHKTKLEVIRDFFEKSSDEELKSKLEQWVLVHEERITEIRKCESFAISKNECGGTPL